MIQKAKPEKSRPGVSDYKGVIILGLSLIFVIAMGIISYKSIHVVMAK